MGGVVDAGLNVGANLVSGGTVGFKDGGLTKGVVTSAVTGGKKKDKGPNDPYTPMDFSSADADAKLRQEMYYGSTAGSLGKESEDYVGRLQGNLDKDYAKADIINQQGSSQRALDNARAGLSGTDMSSQNEQNRRNAGIEGNVYNEQMRQQALDMYGNSIANRIGGANQIVNQNRALQVASMKAPAAQISSGGVLSGIFDGLF